MTYTLRQGYQFYQKEGGSLSYKAFVAVCTMFNVLAMAEIVKGKTLDMGARLARLSIIRLPRNFNKPAIDWNETKKFKQELLDAGETLYSEDTPHGVKYFVHFMTDWFIRFYWEKKNCLVPNKTFYAFRPTGGPKGNKKAAKDHLAADDLNYKDYKLVK